MGGFYGHQEVAFTTSTHNPMDKLGPLVTIYCKGLWEVYSNYGSKHKEITTFEEHMSVSTARVGKQSIKNEKSPGKIEGSKRVDGGRG